MGDPNDGICWLMQCGIWDLFDPDIEGAVKNSCTHMLLSPFFSSSPQPRRTSCEGKGKRHARPELAPHVSGTSTATSSLEYRVFTVPAPYLSRNFFTTSPTCASSVIGVALVVYVFPWASRRMVGVLSKFLYQSVSDPLTGSR